MSGRALSDREAAQAVAAGVRLHLAGDSHGAAELTQRLSASEFARGCVVLNAALTCALSAATGESADAVLGRIVLQLAAEPC